MFPLLLLAIIVQFSGSLQFKGLDIQILVTYFNHHPFLALFFLLYTEKSVITADATLKINLDKFVEDMKKPK
jgi:hypothetical protein